MAITKEPIRVDLTNLHLHIFTMGGDGLGESFLVIIKEGKRICFSMLIDSCVTKVDEQTVNLPLRFIDHYGVKKLDCIIWTHPHDDHSLGLDTIVRQCYGKNTIGFIPQYFFGNERDIVPITAVCRNVRKTFTSVFRKKHLVPVDCASGESRLLVQRIFMDANTEEIKALNIKFCTPIGPIMQERMSQDKPYSQSQLNELSLSLVMEFADYCFFFGGDAPGTKIKMANDEDISRCKWTTIPHHGSKSSRQLRSILRRDIDCATCTTYLSQPLPEKEILELYNHPDSVHVDVTQKERASAFFYGVIEYDYDFASLPNAKLQVKRYGNAYRYS